ncbi:MAG: hypothetical protein DRJ65_16875 [Acidobacteria bacterium]|nr:MAG: hypothetical protein DRJ65_16875 [Acidobacteriota bacterium]
MQAISVFSQKGRYNPDMPGGRPAKTEKRTQFGQRLLEARQSKGLSQTQIAKELGITQPSYADWERKSVSLKPEHLPTLAETLDVTIDHLLGLKQPTNRGNGPTGKLRQLLEEVGGLPRYQRQRVASIVEDMIAAHKAKAS